MTHPTHLLALIVATTLPLCATADDTAAKRASSRPAADARWCSTPTSPRLQRKDDECASAKDWARSHSQRELSETGQGNAVDALKRLDPNVR